MSGENGRPLQPRLTQQMVRKRESALSEPKRKQELDSHEWGKWTIKRESTCTEKGEQSRKCTVCGEEEIESLPLAKHTWDNGKVTQAPSYTKVGVKTWTCSECGKTKTTTLAKLPMPKAGTKVIVGGNQYTVTKAGSEVRFSKANAKARAITVPSTIKASYYLQGNQHWNQRFQKL